ncbi:MAG: DUF4838 domain-containing protein [Clostridia bacterium]|nr:DUF4838 domain-containing protein [Clostridia bacterium]
MKIVTTRSTETVVYAAEELKKYITAMSKGKIVPEFVFGSAAKPTDGAIVLGTLDELSLDTSDLSDPFIEDIVDVDVTNLSGYIAGSNERSILFGVYKFCASAGCRYIRPGEHGDYIPEADLYNHSFTYRKKADALFRGECCEGSISYEHMRDTVYWMPKIGMNMYMIEGTVPITYMHKWYGHVWNTKLRQPGQVTDYNMLEKYIDMLERDIKKTGIQLHTLGHEWMFAKLNVHHSSPENDRKQLENLPDEFKELFAMIGGQRGLFRNNLFATHLCYSNPKARQLLVDTMVEYLEKKPHVDFVHAWLADATNNQCECEECVKKHPSDWYVMFLNELDEALTAKNIQTKVVFITYVDTVRPPETETLKNPSRFVLLSAIGLHYETGYSTEPYTGEIPEYVRNKFVTPPNALRLQWYKDWKEMCGNVHGIIYEYRYYTDMYCDPGYMRVSRETHRDMASLDKIPFDGCMSDQTHRMYMPTALPLIMMGETLFDKTNDFDKCANDYFYAAFGNEGYLVREYLEKLSELFCPSNFRIGGRNGIEEEGLGNIEVKNKPWVNNPDVAASVAQVPGVIDEFLPVIVKNMSTVEEDSRYLSWVYLEQHAEITRRHSEIVLAGAEDNMELAQQKLREMQDYLSEKEPYYHNVFDLFLYLKGMSGKLSMKMPSYWE